MENKTSLGYLCCITSTMLISLMDDVKQPRQIFVFAELSANKRPTQNVGKNNWPTKLIGK